MNTKKLLSLGFALALFSTVIACGGADSPNVFDTIPPDTEVTPDGGTPGTKKPVGGACATDDECDAGLWCDTGLCIDPSDPVKPSQCEGTGCVDGYECDVTDHQCHLKLKPVGPVLTYQCQDNSDCQTGYTCVAGECLPPLPPAVKLDPMNPFTALLPIILQEPKVVATTPTDGHKNTIINPTISVTFNGDMDVASVKEHLKLYVFAVVFELPVDGIVTGAGKVFQFTPASGSLKNGALYEIRVEAGVKNKYGTPMAAQFHSAFETFQ